MRSSGNSRLIVAGDGGRLEGVIAVRDVLGFLSNRLDLESEAPMGEGGGG